MYRKVQAKIRCLKNFDLSFLEDLETALFNLDFHNQNNSDINITCNNFTLMFNNILDKHERNSFLPQTLVNQRFANIHL